MSEIQELKDLFVRRLRDDRDKARLIDELLSRVRAAETGVFRQYLQPVVHALALVIDRVDRYDGSDPVFVTSVRDELLELLAAHGVREVPAAGAFDPALHEIVAVDPDAPDHDIVTVRRRGFAHDNHTFRPAHVVIGGGGSGGAVDE